jgi:predicted transcriptional regulator of viral defense system
MILQLIRKHKKGVRMIDIINESQLDPVKVRNIFVRLKSQGKIENMEWGVYKVS